MLYGTGLSKPAKFKNIIKDLYENKEQSISGLKNKYYFSLLKLSNEQQHKLIIPEGFTSMNINILQVDKTQVQNLAIITFLKKNNYIFSYRYNVIDERIYNRNELINNKHAVTLSPEALIIPQKYNEVYLNIDDKTYLLGLSSNFNMMSVFQYKRKNKYYNNNLGSSSLESIGSSQLYTTKLSKNLKRFIKKYY